MIDRDLAESFGLRTVPAIGASVVYAAALTPSLAIPALTSVLAARWGFNSTQIGLIAAAYPLGLGLTSVSSLFWIARVPWRSFTAFGLVLLGISALLTARATSMSGVLLLMLCSGLGGGIAASPAMTALGEGSAGPRNVAIMILLSVSIPSMVLVLVPHIASNLADPIGFQILGGLALVSVPLVALLPSRNARETDGNRKALPASRLSARAYAAAACMLIFTGGFICAWSFLERIGSASGLPEEPVLQSLAVAELVGGCGGFVATKLTSWLGFRNAFASGTILCAAALFGVGLAPGSLTALLVLGSLFAVWANVTFSNLIVLGAQSDIFGRVVSMAPGLQAFGATIGSASAGVAFERYGPTGVVTASMAAFSLSTLLALRRYPEP